MDGARIRVDSPPDHTSAGMDARGSCCSRRRRGLRQYRSSVSSRLAPAFKDRNIVVRMKSEPGTSLPAMTSITAAAGKELRTIPGVRNVGATHRARLQLRRRVRRRFGRHLGQHQRLRRLRRDRRSHQVGDRRLSRSPGGSKPIRESAYPRGAGGQRGRSGRARLRQELRGALLQRPRQLRKASSMSPA